MASAASTEPMKPLVSTIPSASRAVMPIRVNAAALSIAPAQYRALHTEDELVVVPPTLIRDVARRPAVAWPSRRLPPCGGAEDTRAGRRRPSTVDPARPRVALGSPVEITYKFVARRRCAAVGDD